MTWATRGESKNSQVDKQHVVHVHWLFVHHKELLMQEVLPERTHTRQIPNRQKKMRHRGRKQKILYCKIREESQEPEQKKGARMTCSKQWEEVKKEELHSGRRERADVHTKKQVGLTANNNHEASLQRWSRNWKSKLHASECRVGWGLESEESTAYPQHQEHCQIKDVFIRKDTRSELSVRYLQ